MDQFFVGIVAIVENNNRILLLQKSPDSPFEPNTWELVTGALTLGEQPQEALKRVVKEKTGLETTEAIIIDTGFFYRGPDTPMVYLVFWCKSTTDNVTLSPKHSNYKWLNLKELLNEPLPHFKQIIAKLEDFKAHWQDNV